MDEVKVDGVGQVVLRLSLINPKETKSQHSIQFVEMVVTRDWICSIGAFKAMVNLLGRIRSNLMLFCETADGSLITERLFFIY